MIASISVIIPDLNVPELLYAFFIESEMYAMRVGIRLDAVKISLIVS